MKKIINQKHSRETFKYALSKTLERASYYGFRSLLILYMIDSFQKINRTDAFNIYAWFTFLLLFSKIIGAIIGDLIIGNRKAIIAGGIIQAIGFFSFCIHSTIGLYIGLFFVSFGNGLYTPNITSNFGKLYFNKTKLLDAGFTILYLAASLGAFISVITIGNIKEKYDWNFSFIVIGILMLLSIIPIIINNDNKLEQATNNELNTKNRTINIIIAFIVVSLFWFFYHIGNYQIIDLQLKLREFLKLDFPKKLWTYLDSVFIIPISLIAIITWTYYYINQYYKLLIGLIFGFLSFAILFMIPEIPTEKHLIIYFTSLLLLDISVIHISPIFYSILTKNSNPKYLAILFSLTDVPIGLFYGIIGIYNKKFYDNPLFSLKFTIIGMMILIFGLIIFIKWKKKNTHNTVYST